VLTERPARDKETQDQAAAVFKLQLGQIVRKQDDHDAKLLVAEWKPPDGRPKRWPART
jgi:hypothetical protein